MPRVDNSGAATPTAPRPANAPRRQLAAAAEAALHERANVQRELDACLDEFRNGNMRSCTFFSITVILHLNI